MPVKREWLIDNNCDAPEFITITGTRIKFWFDRIEKLWFAVPVDAEGEQTEDGIDAPSRDLLLIYIGMELLA